MRQKLYTRLLTLVKIYPFPFVWVSGKICIDRFDINLFLSYNLTVSALHKDTNAHATQDLLTSPGLLKMTIFMPE